MPHLVTITVELDTEYEKEARRLSYIVCEELMHEDWINGIACGQPELGELPSGE